MSAKVRWITFSNSRTSTRRVRELPKRRPGMVDAATGAQVGRDPLPIGGPTSDSEPLCDLVESCNCAVGYARVPGAPSLSRRAIRRAVAVVAAGGAMDRLRYLGRQRPAA
jgi:hypothetical protein